MSADSNAVSRPAAQSRAKSAQERNPPFLVLYTLHYLWGKALRKIFPFQWTFWVEESLYLGVIPLLLCLFVLFTTSMRAI